MTENLRFVDCEEDLHSVAILAILNDAIVTSTALYDYLPRPPEAMKTWFATKHANGFPVIGAVDAEGELLGFASWGHFRMFPAYKYSVEHSVYVRKDYRGSGLGRALMHQLISRAKASQVHVLIGCIDASNAGSIALHKRLGFTHSGTFPEVGFKFGKWLDAVFYQLNLEGPLEPRDG
ncbi:GNAT family N-acetyltransferase [Acidovorax sp.]|uniref:GNAT family N-acetyltransferase n=1 Tax=Acidovorax sp. TaxID=1872122 RepID=UPI002FB08A16